MGENIYSSACVPPSAPAVNGDVVAPGVVVVDVLAVGYVVTVGVGAGVGVVCCFLQFWAAVVAGHRDVAAESDVVAVDIAANAVDQVATVEGGGEVDAAYSNVVVFDVLRSFLRCTQKDMLQTRFQMHPSPIQILILLL